MDGLLQILSYLVACDHLCELGYDETQVEEALEMFQNCETKVIVCLICYIRNRFLKILILNVFSIIVHLAKFGGTYTIYSVCVWVCV